MRQISKRGPVSLIFFILCILLTQVLGQEITKQGFDKLPNGFFYFKDSQVTLKKNIIIRAFTYIFVGGSLA